jgi:hypothetical protein
MLDQVRVYNLGAFYHKGTRKFKLFKINFSHMARKLVDFHLHSGENSKNSHSNLLYLRIVARIKAWSLC